MRKKEKRTLKMTDIYCSTFAVLLELLYVMVYNGTGSSTST